MHSKHVFTIAIALAIIVAMAMIVTTKPRPAPQAAEAALAPTQPPPSKPPASPAGLADEIGKMEQTSYQLLESGQYHAAAEMTLAIIEALGTSPDALPTLRQLSVGWEQATSRRGVREGEWQFGGEIRMQLGEARIEVFRRHPELRHDTFLLSNAVAATATAARDANRPDAAAKYYLIGLDEFRHDLPDEDIIDFYRMAASTTRRTEGNDAAAAIRDRGLADIPPDFSTVDGAKRLVGAALIYGQGNTERALRLLTEAAEDPVLRANPVGWAYVAGHAASELEFAGAYIASANLRLDIAQTLRSLTDEQKALQKDSFSSRSYLRSTEMLLASQYISGINAALQGRNVPLAFSIAEQYKEVFAGVETWGERAAEQVERVQRILDQPEAHYQAEEEWKNIQR